MAKFFPRSLKGDASQWFYNFLGGSIDSFKSLVKAFMGQYKHNIKEQGTIIELCVMHQGNSETLEKYIPRLKKVWQSIYSKLDESEIYGIFRYSILSIIDMHAPCNKNIGFRVLVQELL